MQRSRARRMEEGKEDGREGGGREGGRGREGMVEIVREVKTEGRRKRDKNSPWLNWLYSMSQLERLSR